jgi:hypothetical protein
MKIIKVDWLVVLNSIYLALGCNQLSQNKTNIGKYYFRLIYLSVYLSIYLQKERTMLVAERFIIASLINK